MNRKFLLALAASLAVAVNAYSQIVVDSSIELGPIKPMNAVNNGPKVAPASQKKAISRPTRQRVFPTPGFTTPLFMLPGHVAWT